MDILVRVGGCIAILLAICGCTVNKQTGPCDGLVYTDAGLDRRAYAPCARAMVAELDQMQRAVETFGIEGLPKAERAKARVGCLAAGARLSKLVSLAGGKTKLMARWDDDALNRLNLEILMSRDEYSMFCYYGKGSKTANHAKAQQILAGLY